ncbi:MAG: YwbE family protein [Thaumarchaeota archaeon]|nr:YwbE family protein [Nitrososphaerota archaeon]MDE1872242.1 YwbE family protein [Nitrososphaerota archaeon]
MNELPSRDKIKIGTSVLIVQKQDQLTGVLTEGVVKKILTSSNSHPHGIKVELDNGKIGRVQKCVNPKNHSEK